MENAEIRVMPIGHLDFLIDIDYAFVNTEPVVSGRWRRTSSGGNLLLPATSGAYIWRRATLQAVFSDDAGAPWMSLEELQMPPVGTEVGPGLLLFPQKKGTIVSWEIS